MFFFYERRSLDRKISELPGVKFCFSSITQHETSGRSLLPAVAYLIVYTESVACNKEIIFSALHADTEAAVEDVTVRGAPENAARRLFLAVKDHNNRGALELVSAFKLHCEAAVEDVTVRGEPDIAARRLFLAVKDHSNRGALELVSASKLHCEAGTNMIFF